MDRVSVSFYHFNHFFEIFFCRRGGGWDDVVSCEFKEVYVSSQQLKSAMSVAYLLLGGPDVSQRCDPFVKGIVTPDRCFVFSIIDFLQIVLRVCINRKHAEKLWQTICKQNSQFMYVPGTLDLLVPSKKMPENQPTAGTTVAGLKAVLDVLSRNHVTDANRKILEDIFARHAAGDWSMIVQINLNDKEHPQIPRFNYNFQPPSVSHEPVASVIIEDVEAGAAEPVSSRESSCTSIEYDFTSTDDHMVRSRA